jgi:hypothetical protein
VRRGQRGPFAFAAWLSGQVVGKCPFCARRLRLSQPVAWFSFGAEEAEHFLVHRRCVPAGTRVSDPVVLP